MPGLEATLPQKSESSAFWHDNTLGLDLTHAHVGAHRFKKHSHDSYVIVVTETGELHATIGGTDYFMRSGSVLILHPGQPHQGEAESQSGWTFRAYYPPAVEVTMLVEEVTGKYIDMPDFPILIEDAATSHKLLCAHRVIEHGDTNSRQTAYFVALNALVDWCHCSSARQQRSYHAYSQIELVRNYILSRYTESITVKDLATIAGCGVFQLMRAFERHVGVPVHTYITQVRLKHACTLLAKGEPSAAVAAAVGFSDQSHLIRRFRQAFGVTPGSYVRYSR